MSEVFFKGRSCGPTQVFLNIAAAGAGDVAHWVRTFRVFRDVPVRVDFGLPAAAAYAANIAIAPKFPACGAAGGGAVTMLTDECADRIRVQVEQQWPPTFANR